VSLENSDGQKLPHNIALATNCNCCNLISLQGFCAIPGSHKSQLTLPRERPTSIDLPVVYHVAMEAGDVLIFLAGQVTHGAFKWHGPENRRALLMNYVPSAHFDTRMEFRVLADAKL
jgi:ectoine hydroxylase-related dioxygenase (phytanoyl-CoA dioxygenase family)